MFISLRNSAAFTNTLWNSMSMTTVYRVNMGGSVANVRYPVCPGIVNGVWVVRYFFCSFGVFASLLLSVLSVDFCKEKQEEIFEIFICSSRIIFHRWFYLRFNKFQIHHVYHFRFDVFFNLQNFHRLNFGETILLQRFTASLHLFNTRWKWTKSSTWNFEI